MSFDATYTDTGHPARPRTDWSNLLVPPAMSIAAIALGVASYLHLGLSAELAVAVGLSLFCLMLLCHVLLRAADAAEKEAEAAAERRTEQVASPLPAPVRGGLPPLPQPKANCKTRGTDASSTDALPKGDGTEPTQPAKPSMEPASPVAGGMASLDSAPEPTSRGDRTADIAGGLGSVRQSVVNEAAEKASRRPKGWTYRPVDLKLPVVEPLPPSAAPPAIAGNFKATDIDPRPPAESDRIDAILTRLAAQIREGAKLAESAGSGDPATAAPTNVSGGKSVDSPAAGPADAALSSAVDALRSTVEAMRSGVLPASGEANARTTTVSPAEARLAAVAEALAAERADVFLEPILALADEQARHFEVSVRLKAASGETLDARRLTAVAGGAGLLPLLDALGVRHAAGFALKLERRGRDGAVFSAIDGRSLESESFVADVAGRHAQGISDRLVLAFAQAEMRGLGPAQLAALGDLGQLGFRFALQGVSDLDMDFEALRALGFEFVKLDADVFLKGLLCGGAEVPASDLCRHFAELGLAVIVSSIDDQSLHQRVMGCGVVFGQGRLFGGPRPIPVAGTTGGSIAA